MSIWRKWVAENPVFRYHFLGQTRMLARRPIWQVLLIAGIFTAIYLWFLKQALQHGLPAIALGLECLALWLVAPLMTHSLFAAEFEKATWEMLILTRLTAGQIVMGKFLSRLAILLFLALCFILPLWIGMTREYQMLPPTRIASLLLKTQLVAIGWSILLIAVTLWLSYWLKRGMIAAAVAFAGQVLALFILPILWGIFWALFIESSGRGSIDPFSFDLGQEGWLKYGWMVDPRFAVWFYNPVAAVAGIFATMSEPVNEQLLLWGTWQGIVYILLAALIAALLTRRIARVTRKPI
ncbi:MAG: hypothetical protein ACK40X_08205 [Armatimonadota bacterium]